MKLIFCITLFLCPCVLMAQQPLGIGNTLPPPLTAYLAKQVAKTNATTAPDLTIYNFMATTCGSCIRSLPAFVQLQKKYEGRFQMILVSNQAAPKMEAWFAKNPSLRLPVIAADTVMHRYFPHTYISHLVWVNAQQKVVAITSGAYLAESSLQQALSGASLHWPVKQDDRSYDYRQPLFGFNYSNLQESSTPQALSYVAVVSHIPAVSPRFTIQKDTLLNTSTHSFINKSLPVLFATIFNRNHFFAAQFRLCVADSGRFFKEFSPLLKDDWQTLNLHSIEARFPLYQSPAQTQQALLLAVSNYARCTASIDSVAMPVLVVSGQPASAVMPAPEKPLSLDALVYRLNSEPAAQPVFIAPGTHSGAKLNVPYGATLTRAQILQAIRQQGYTIDTLYRKVEIISIADKP